MTEFPALMEAMLIIKHDIGCGNNCDDHPLGFPDEYAVHAPIANAYLASLDQDQLETFCIGEETEMMAMVNASNIAKLSHDFLTDFFHGFEPKHRQLAFLEAGE
ncbi:MAG: hypothetical protein AAGA08_17040 [Pseudomonadota bacterium]